MKNKRALRTKLERKRQKYLTCCVLGKRTVTTKSVWQEKEKEKEKESRARVSLCVYPCARKRLVVAVVIVVNRRQNTPRVFCFLYTNNIASEIKSKMSGGKKEEVKIEREEHVRDVFENFRTSKITRDDVARLRLNNSSSSSINSDKSSNSLKSVDDGTTRTIIDVLREIFLQRREEDEEDCAKFYHFCFLACLKGKTEGTNATISVHEACELWSFLLSSTKKQQLRKSSSSLSIEEGGAPPRTTTATTTNTPSSVLAKGMLLPRWMNRTFCKFCTERASSSSSPTSSVSPIVDENTFLRTLDFARSYRKNNGCMQDWYGKQQWPTLIDDFVSSLGREKNTTNENDKSVGNDDADQNRMDEELASSSLAADVAFRRGKGGRVGMKTVHPRGQKRKEQEANVEVLSSQLSSALETKKRKTGGIRLDYFD